MHHYKLPAFIMAPDASALPNPDILFKSLDDKSTTTSTTQKEAVKSIDVPQDKENKPQLRPSIVREVQRSKAVQSGGVKVSLTIYNPKPTASLGALWIPPPANNKRRNTSSPHGGGRLKKSRANHNHLDGFPSPPKLVDIQRMEPHLPLVEQLLRASDANEICMKVLAQLSEKAKRNVVEPSASFRVVVEEEEEEKEKEVVKAKEAVKAEAVRLTVIRDEPCVARGLAQWISLEVYKIAALDGAATVRLFAESSSFSPCVTAVQEVVDILGQDENALIHGMILVRKFFQYFHLCGEDLRGGESRFTAALIIQRVFTIALQLGQKYGNDDVHPGNGYRWARALGYTRQEMLPFELAFAEALEWHLDISPREWSTSVREFLKDAQDLPFPYDGPTKVERCMVLHFLRGRQISSPIPLRTHHQENIPTPFELSRREKSIERMLKGIEIEHGIVLQMVAWDPVGDPILPKGRG